MTVTERSQNYKAYIEQYLAEHYAQFDSEPQQVLYDAMRYSLLAGGKRLRPIFAFEFCRLCGADWQKAAPMAAAVEMVHTYSLIMTICPAWTMMTIAAADSPTTRFMAKPWRFWPVMLC